MDREQEIRRALRRLGDEKASPFQVASAMNKLRGLLDASPVEVKVATRKPISPSVREKMIKVHNAWNGPR